ncbi:MAG: MerR family transcriptional regulator [Prevotellaceae bacterium]|jgi:DNA-binding transcriptional MerR regulator|nr:MerR family transcriptional regulator [Prevotellaceae bacterium]
MADEKNESEKLFYSIGEVADIFGEETSLIRFWTNHFRNIINPKRNKKGNRLFSQQDVETIKLIHFLVRKQGMKLDGAYKRIIENREGTTKNMQVIETLERIKKQLLEIKKNI